ncbi:MAG: DUF4974 domain-containing protein [Bacteroidetes bacterium]|nr:DUF4974 domain-containing protein [Bacteroidota bacterium]
MARRMAGELTPEEALELQRALDQDPGLQQLLKALGGIAESSPRGVSPMEERQLMEKGLRQLRQRAAGLHVVGLPSELPAGGAVDRGGTVLRLEGRTLRSRSLRWSAAAAIVLLGTIGGYLYTARQPRKEIPVAYRELAAKYGTRSYVELPDGSQLWLNAGSKVRYAEGFASGVRELTLEGEAFFDIKHDPGQPFIIHTHGLDVKVLGTSLNVRAYAGDSVVETTLIQGKAQIELRDPQEEPIVLRPGEKVTLRSAAGEGEVQHPGQATAGTQSPPAFSRHAVTTDSTYKTIIETSWVEDKLVFRNKPFREVAAQLERWYNIRFHFANQDYLNDKLTGYFKDQPIKNVMDGLQLSLGFHYEIAGDSILIK